MQLKIYEILERFKTVYPHEKVRFLQYNNSKTLRDILFFTFSPSVRFYRQNEPPNYKPNITDPVGLAPNNLYDESRKFYLFVVGHPQSKLLTQKRKDELLLQFLEGLEAKEAQVVLNMLSKDLKIEGLTSEIVKRAFPDLPL